MGDHLLTGGLGPSPGAGSPGRRGSTPTYPLDMMDDEETSSLDSDDVLPAMVSPAAPRFRRKTPTPMSAGRSPRSRMRSGLRPRSKSMDESPAVRARIVSVCELPEPPALREPGKLLGLARACSLVAGDRPTLGAEAFDSDSDDDGPGLADFRARRAEHFQNRSLFEADDAPRPGRAPPAQPCVPRRLEGRPGRPRPPGDGAPATPRPMAGGGAEEEKFRRRLATAAATSPWGRPPNQESDADAKCLRSFARKAKRFDDAAALAPPGDDVAPPSKKRARDAASNSSTSDEELDPHSSFLGLLFGGMRAQ